MKKDPVKLTIDRFGRLVVTTQDGRTFTDVVPVRCFPFTAPDEKISLCDEKGAEIHLIEHVDMLEPDSRKVMLAELDRRDFMPTILKIHNISTGSEPNNWDVDTDRGSLTFTLPSEDNVRPLRPHGCIIQDANGVRYRVPDTRRMDAKSRRFIGRYS